MEVHFSAIKLGLESTGDPIYSYRLSIIAFIILLTLMSFVISILIVELLMPLFNKISGMHFSLSNVFSPSFLIIMAGLILFLGIITGSYPSLILSKYQPVEVLKGNLKTGKGNFFSRLLRQRKQIL